MGNPSEQKVESARFRTLSTQVWRRGWDSNPCGIAPKLISSQPRYDLFDTSPYLIFVRTLIGNCKAPFLFPASQSRENRRKTELLRENRSFRAVPSDETEPLSSQPRYDLFDTSPYNRLRIAQACADFSLIIISQPSSVVNRN